MSGKVERLKKIRALALEGVGGEKEQAQALLDKLTEKYNVSFDEIDEETINNYEFEYHGKEQKQLLRQTIYKITNDSGSTFSLRYLHSGRKCKTKLSAKCTATQKAEIEFLFDFYKRLWEKERQALLLAFIQKHRIFGQLKDGEEPTELTDEETEKILALMRGLSNESPQKQIDEHSKNGGDSGKT